MDVKMGTRTFLESEVKKTVLRKDLLQKMLKMDENEPTEEEKENGITKLRYMTYREKLSSSRNLGFRVEGIRYWILGTFARALFPRHYMTLLCVPVAGCGAGFCSCFSKVSICTTL